MNIFSFDIFNVFRFELPEGGILYIFLEPARNSYNNLPLRPNVGDGIQERHVGTPDDRITDSREERHLSNKHEIQWYFMQHNRCYDPREECSSAAASGHHVCFPKDSKQRKRRAGEDEMAWIAQSVTCVVYRVLLSRYNRDKIMM